MSDDRINVVLWSWAQAIDTLRRAAEWLRPKALAGQRFVLELRPETRSDAQNRLLHSRINDVRKQCEWAGRKWDTEDWKRLLTAAWCRTRNEGVEMVPAIDGKGFDVLYQRTSKLSRRECADLSEFVMAWGTQQGVQWCAASLGRDGYVIDPQTGEILEAV
jgi:hypothetical protein